MMYAGLFTSSCFKSLPLVSKNTVLYVKTFSLQFLWAFFQSGIFCFVSLLLLIFIDKVLLMNCYKSCCSHRFCHFITPWADSLLFFSAAVWKNGAIPCWLTVQCLLFEVKLQHMSMLEMFSSEKDNNPISYLKDLMPLWLLPTSYAKTRSLQPKLFFTKFDIFSSTGEKIFEKNTKGQFSLVLIGFSVRYQREPTEVFGSFWHSQGLLARIVSLEDAVLEVCHEQHLLPSSQIQKVLEVKFLCWRIIRPEHTA